jgi:hypothetical protein
MALKNVNSSCDGSMFSAGIHQLLIVTAFIHFFPSNLWAAALEVGDGVCIEGFIMVRQHAGLFLSYHG